MPNPKRRHSKSRGRKRRTHDALTAARLSECPNCHELRVAHRICPHCGHFAGREYIPEKVAKQ
jgi:large subunit ribosomal protein L32